VNTLWIVGMAWRLGLRGNVVAGPAPRLSRAHRLATGRTTGSPTAKVIIEVERHQRERRRCIEADDGTITDRRIATSWERFTAVFGERPRARMLLEASSERKWGGRHLESLGHRVIVAAPNAAPMYANWNVRSRTEGGGPDTISHGDPNIHLPNADGRRRHCPHLASIS
jgi:hypothetical protein